MSYDCWCDYDLPEWHRVVQIKRARKPHKCDECRAVIPAGSPYEYVSGKWGQFDHFHICQLCKELREWAEISVPCFCWAYGNLHEDVSNMVDSVRSKVPGFFFEYGRRMIKIKRARAALKQEQS